jgi:membrane protease YdiL (CAAX protease family)
MIGIFAKSFSNGKGMPQLDEKSLMTYLEPNWTLFLIMLSFVFAMLGIYIVVKNIHKQTMLSITTSRAKVDWSRIFFSFTIWSLFTVISTTILFYISPESFVMNFKLVPFLILVVIGTLMIPIQTSCEEYVFRGYLMQGFGNLARNKWFPLVMTSSIFGLMHIANPEVTKMGYIVLVYYIGTGFFLGILTLMDEGMELSLGFHAANNLIGALLVTADWSVFQTHSILKDISDPSAGFDVILPVLILYPILLFIFAKKYNWINWKEKLTGKIYLTNSNLINEKHVTND